MFFVPPVLGLAFSPSFEFICHGALGDIRPGLLLVFTLAFAYVPGPFHWSLGLGGCDLLHLDMAWVWAWAWALGL